MAARSRSAGADPAVVEAAASARGPQGLWALVPVPARARYLRRTGQAILDEVEALADLLADEAGIPRTEAMLAELLPSVGGLHGLADDGPAALREQRLGRLPLLRAGRLSVLLQAPLGVVGVRSTSASPWAEATLEVAAALLAGNGVVLSPAAGAAAAAARLAGAFERAGLPDGLLQVVAPGADLAAACDRVVGDEPARPKGTMLVLDGAPLEGTVAGALWAAFARAGRGPAAVGRVVVVPSVAEALLRGLEAAARRLRVGDPRDPETEVGPLDSAGDLVRVESLVEQAIAGGATLVCGGRAEVAGRGGPYFAPAVLRSVAPDAAILREHVPGPVLAVVEAASEADAIALAAGAAHLGDAHGRSTVSVWTADRGHGERVARVLGAELSWVNEHGFAAAATPVRLARHVDPRQIASQPPNLRSARWLPYDPELVRASTTAARLVHGRESERVAALRSGAVPLVRVAARMAREALGR